jgi:hypothetical protein
MGCAAELVEAIVRLDICTTSHKSRSTSLEKLHSHEGTTELDEAKGMFDFPQPPGLNLLK